MLPNGQGRTLCSCKMCIDPLVDHVLTGKQHTGSIRGHNHLMDVLAPPVVMCLCTVLRYVSLALPVHSLVWYLCTVLVVPGLSRKGVTPNGPSI